ncbi:MAG TPA: MCP four helix bundle domain-containing protein [Candidatus Binatia bacterium]|nr:MCP four helix bundle domain-containing protein [Candidatus Binatia bacterium]
MKVSLGKKLGLGFGAVLSLMAASTLAAYWRISQVEHTQSHLMTLRIPTLDATQQLQRDLFQTASKSRQAILAGAQDERRKDALRRFDDIWAKVDKDIAVLADLSTGFVVAENREHVMRIKEKAPHLREVQRATIDMAASGGAEGVVKAGNEYADRATPLNDSLVGDLNGLARFGGAATGTRQGISGLGQRRPQMDHDPGSHRFVRIRNLPGRLLEPEDHASNRFHSSGSAGDRGWRPDPR